MEFPSTTNHQQPREEAKLIPKIIASHSTSLVDLEPRNKEPPLINLLLELKKHHFRTPRTHHKN